MSATGTPHSPIVFLHIPKTAGQAIHTGLVEAFGEQTISAIRVHTQAAAGAAQLPPGFGVYSGHLDWDRIDTLPDTRFVFSVVRDPRERIASFYLYLRDRALKIPPPERSPGHRKVATWSADDYFFGGDAAWRAFIVDHYDNFMCHYLATRKVRAASILEHHERVHLSDRAYTQARALGGVYSINTLDDLERDLSTKTGKCVDLARRRINTGSPAGKDSRWHTLCTRFERDKTRSMLEEFVEHDQVLVRRLGFT